MNAVSFDRLLSVGQVADLLSLSSRSVRRLLPEIGYVRVGRAIRIPQSFLENYLQTRSVPPSEGFPRRRAPAEEGIALIVDQVIGKNRRRDS